MITEGDTERVIQEAYSLLLKGKTVFIKMDTREHHPLCAVTPNYAEMKDHIGIGYCVYTIGKIADLPLGMGLAKVSERIRKIIEHEQKTEKMREVYLNECKRRWDEKRLGIGYFE